MSPCTSNREIISYSCVAGSPSHPKQKMSKVYRKLPGAPQTALARASNSASGGVRFRRTVQVRSRWGRWDSGTQPAGIRIPRVEF